MDSFGVNIVGAGHQALANQFAGVGGLKGPDRYRGWEWTRLASGAPLWKMPWRPSIAQLKRRLNGTAT